MIYKTLLNVFKAISAFQLVALSMQTFNRGRFGGSRGNPTV